MTQIQLGTKVATPSKESPILSENTGALSPAMKRRDLMDHDTRYKLHRRFDRLARLYGDPAVRALMESRVVIFGVGGVGGLVAEALARSAIGHIKLVDFDEVCITNVNRQIQALKGTVGKDKAELLAERLRRINPNTEVVVESIFYNAARSERLLECPWPGRTQDYDFVIDCIDHLASKVHLLSTCVKREIPIVSSMGAAGKTDPTQIRIADLSESKGCPLAREVRRKLRKDYGFPASGPLGITAAYSAEQRVWPKALDYDEGQGFKCVCPNYNPEHNCDARQLIDGSVMHVTGAMGFAVASAVVNTIAKPLMSIAPDEPQKRDRARS